MFLHRIHIDPRCRDARRDLADPYQLHSTLCRAFSEPETKCPAGEFLWRQEPEVGAAGCPRILVQGRVAANWSRIGVNGWLAKADPTIDLRERLKLDSLGEGRQLRFRLRANPTVTRNGKRLGLMRRTEQKAWLVRKGEQHGFVLPGLSAQVDSAQVGIDVSVSEEQMLKGQQHAGNGIRIYSVLYDGVLTVKEPAKFIDALTNGIGHGKVVGLGLLSVAPVKC